MAIKKSKRFKKILTSNIMSNNPLTIDEALLKIKEYKNNFSVKFDESIDICLELNIDPKKSDQIIKSKIKLPFHNGKKVSLLVISDDNELMTFYKGANDKAVDIHDSSIIDKIQMDQKVLNKYTNIICSKDLLPKVSKIARILGSKSLMPSVKNDTIFKDSSEAKSLVESLKEGSVSIRNDDFGYVSFSIGRSSYEDSSIKSNIISSCKSISSLKPSVIKAALIKSIKLSTTMGVSFSLLNSEIFN